MSSEKLFFSLPRETQRRIDSVFDSVAGKKLTTESSLGELPAGGFIPESGGFIREDEDDHFEGGSIHENEPGGGFLRDAPDVPRAISGGFLPEDDHQEHSAHSQIPLSLVPAALQHLDLPPDDDEVLAVFHNAARGWTSSRNDVNDSQKPRGQDQFVSREDWRSVCAVLLEDDSEGKDAQEEDLEMSGSRIESDDAPDSDEYRESEAEVEEAESDYIEGPTTRRRNRRKVHQSPSTSPSPSASPDSRARKLTSRQRQTCVDAYTLFFSTAPKEELLNQRIMIKDIQRVARVLNEKLKAEEMIEMLETFSTSPDKSMSFDDFCRMMIVAKLA